MFRVNVKDEKELTSCLNRNLKVDLSGFFLSNFSSSSFIYLPVNCAGAKQAIGSPTYCFVDTTTVNNINKTTENRRDNRSYESSSL